MGLIDAFLGDAVPFNVWIAARSDGISGSGTASDPFNGATRRALPLQATLDAEDFDDLRKALATTPAPHGFENGDVVEISGVPGSSAGLWNGIFTIYGVTATTFKYYMKKPVDEIPEAPSICTKLTFPFDAIMRGAPPNIRIHLGPGVFQTRGFAANDARGWQPKTGQKIVGVGFDVTILQLVGAENADQHYHVVGMPIEPIGGATTTPLEHFEVSTLTIDCNMDQQPERPDPGYASVACGAVRVLGNHCRIHNVKAINWGTKSLKEGCFVISIIQASGQPTGSDGNPIITACANNGIEDCIVIQPTKNSARETTILHIGGVKNVGNHAQGFGSAAFIRKNFVDAQYFSTVGLGHPDATAFSSNFITAKSGTLITGDTGTFIGKRAHFRNDLDERRYVRFYNPKDPLSRWNGYFPVTPVSLVNDTLLVELAASTGTTNDSSFVIMGTEFRAIGVSSCINAVVEQNQIHNCWIGGPYQSPMDDSVNTPTAPPTLAREERLDPLNAGNTRSLVVRDNFYRNVAVGPYLNMGGVSGLVPQMGEGGPGPTFYYYPSEQAVVLVPAHESSVWLNARVVVESLASQVSGVHEVIALGPFGGDSHPPQAFAFKISATPPSIFTASYRVVSGTDFLVIEGNQIFLSDPDETEFAPKEYPLASTPAAQKYRPYGIIVADNELTGGYAHRQVIIRKNKINHLDQVNTSRVTGIGAPAGGGMMLTGIKQLHVTDNILEVNARNPMRTYRCGAVRFFNNTQWDGTVIPGWKGDTDGHYDEPETLAEDAFILSLLLKRKRGR